MSVIVISDTHMPKRAKAFPAPLVADLEKADLIIHGGDLVAGDILESLKKYAPVQAVYGNMDEPALKASLPRRLTFEVLGRPIGMLHGDGFGPAQRRAQASFANDEVDLVIYGHTHRPVLARDAGTLMFNPGSPTDRRGEPRHSYGRIILGADGKLTAEHVYL